MFGTVIALLVLLLGAVAVGVAVPALYWVSVVALGGLLLAGAVAVSIVAARGEDDEDDRAAQGHAPPQLRLVGPRPPAATPAAQPGADERRAA